jgi:DNA-binding MarR family transcriptional regulator
MDSSKFNVNILSSMQIEASRRFSSKAEDKFTNSTWIAGRLGIPLLDGCLAHLECEKHVAVEGGDHTILIGRVRRVSRYEGEPLLFSRGQYCVPASHPDASPTPEVSLSKGETRSEETIVSQIFEAHNVLSARFDEHRHAEGVDIAIARVLASLYDCSGLGMEDLATATYLGQRDTEDAVAELRRRNLLYSGPDGLVILTEAGRKIREAIWSRWQDFQHSQIAGISDPDLRSTIRTLQELISRNQSAHALELHNRRRGLGRVRPREQA